MDGLVWLSVDALLLSEEDKMAGIVIIGIAVVVSFCMYCCVRVGALEDRKMEELRKKEKPDADGESG